MGNANRGSKGSSGIDPESLGPPMESHFASLLPESILSHLPPLKSQHLPSKSFYWFLGCIDILFPGFPRDCFGVIWSFVGQCPICHLPLIGDTVAVNRTFSSGYYCDVETEDFAILMGADRRSDCSDPTLEHICHSYCNHPGRILAGAIHILDCVGYGPGLCDDIFCVFEQLVGVVDCSPNTKPEFEKYCQRRRREIGRRAKNRSVGALGFEDAKKLLEEKDAVFESGAGGMFQEIVGGMKDSGDQQVRFWSVEDVSEYSKKEVVFAADPRSYNGPFGDTLRICPVLVKAFVVNNFDESSMFSVPSSKVIGWNSGIVDRGVRSAKWEAGYVVVGAIGHVIVMRTDRKEAVVNVLDANEVRVYFGTDPLSDTKVVQILDAAEERVLMVMSEVWYRQFTGLVALLSHFTEVKSLPLMQPQSRMDIGLGFLSHKRIQSLPRSLFEIDEMILCRLMEAPFAQLIREDPDFARTLAEIDWSDRDDRPFVVRPNSRLMPLMLLLMDDDFHPKDPLSPFITPADFDEVSMHPRARIGVMFGTTYLEWTRESVVMQKKVVDLQNFYYYGSKPSDERLIAATVYNSSFPPARRQSEFGGGTTWALFLPSPMLCRDCGFGNSRSAMARVATVCALYNRCFVFGSDEFVARESSRLNYSVRSGVTFVEDVIDAVFTNARNDPRTNFFGHGQEYAGNKGTSLFWHLLRRNGSAPLIHHPSARLAEIAGSTDLVRVRTHRDFDLDVRRRLPLPNEATSGHWGSCFVVGGALSDFEGECASRKLAESFHRILWFRHLRDPQHPNYQPPTEDGVMDLSYQHSPRGLDRICNYPYAARILKYCQHWHSKQEVVGVIRKDHEVFEMLRKETANDDEEAGENL